MRLGTLFSGFGCVDIGAIQAGITPLWAVEYDAPIAAVYRHNLGDHVTVADIATLNPSDFQPVDILHASPPCPNFSVAKAGAVETERDIALAVAVADFIAALQPPFITLENVYGYRKSQSWQLIARTLHDCGYAFQYWHVNAADYGVPQKRWRMVVIARRDGIRPNLPTQTHAENPRSQLFGALACWRGWYQTVEDLIPSLPDAKFAPWQLQRLPVEFVETFIVDGGNASSMTTCTQDEPVFTVVANNKTVLRAHVAGRIVRMTPRALARFQSFPDWYELPENATLATKGIGNAVPPLLMQRLFESLVN
ncbi:MAG: DNA cytosine methyltransferase [Anaerolineae bacterium]|nr:DNA cytosine methyltransferase [Anaerolineae bacterium]MCO5191445.1 DNA cytosine methyltransferase [Anaerolineae bacterium]MCO5195471.1 DNA cytosine methyltransferase [Anaerolineae bacterium]